MNFLVTLWDWAFDFGAVGHPLYKCAMQSSLRYYEMNISKWACKDPCNDNATKKRFWSMNTISFLFKAPISSSLGQSQSSLTLKITITSIWLIFCFLFCLFNKAFFIFCFTSLLHTFSIYTIPTQKNYWGQAKPSVLPNDSLPIKTVFDLVWWVVVSLCNAIYVDVRNSIVKCKPLITYYIN